MENLICLGVGVVVGALAKPLVMKVIEKVKAAVGK